MELEATLNLKPKQSAAAMHLAMGKSGRETAKTVGVSEESISRWRKEPVFAAQVNSLKLEAVEDAREHLRSLNGKAVRTVAKLLDSPSDSIRLRAAQFVLQAMILDPKTAEKGIGETDPPADGTVTMMRFRWTDKMDADFEEALAQEKDLAAILAPTPAAPEEKSS